MTVADAHGEPTPRHREPMPSASTELRISAAPTREMYPKMKLHFSLVLYLLALSASRFMRMECDVVHLMHDMKKSFREDHVALSDEVFNAHSQSQLHQFDTKSSTGEYSPMRVASRFTHTHPLPLSGIGMRRDGSDDSPLSLSLFLGSA